MSSSDGFYKVTFITDKGETVTRGFDSPYQAKVFANKIRHSKRCRLVACVNF